MRGKLYKVIESRGEKTYIRIGFTFMWKSIRHHTKSHEFHCQHYWSGVRGFGFWKHQEHLHIFGSSRAQPKQILAFPWFFYRMGNLLNDFGTIPFWIRYSSLYVVCARRWKLLSSATCQITHATAMAYYELIVIKVHIVTDTSLKSCSVLLSAQKMTSNFCFINQCMNHAMNIDQLNMNLG